MARMMLERAVINAPSDPEAYVLLGNIALQERRVTEAEMCFNKSKELLASFSIPDRKKILEKVLSERGISGDKRSATIAKRIKDAGVTGYMGAASIISPFLPMIVNAIEDLRVNELIWQSQMSYCLFYL